VGTGIVALDLAKTGDLAQKTGGVLPTAARPDSTPLQQTLDDALVTIAAVLTAAGDVVPIADAVSAVDQCRAQLSAGTGPEIFDPLAKRCFESTRSIAAHARTRTSEQRNQIAALLAMVHETVSTVAGSQQSVHEVLTGSAERFERIAQAGSLQQMQALLVSEVATLKRVTIERRAAWERTSHEFGTRLASLESQLDHTRREAAVDPLTNIANRRAFELAYRERLQPAGQGFVIAMIDVDNFKTINDQCGHAVGDRVLVAVAQSLTGSLRSDDVVARLGGDEFVVLAAGLTLGQAEMRLNGIGRAVKEACRPLVPEGIATSISIGVAERSAGDTAESLQQRADAALYEAKRAGKGRVAAKASVLIRDLKNSRHRP
jgi:diguanylate cyclase (GGDEF)-like protein